MQEPVTTTAPRRGAEVPAPGAAEAEGSPSRAQLCADELSDAILGGGFQPGQRLDEVALGVRFGVSRNTLREAFRLVGQSRLVEHRPNRGVFVREVGAAEARHVFAVRRQLELGALDEVRARQTESGDPLDAAALAAMDSSLMAARSARDAGDWAGVGTANAVFHLSVVDLARNPVASRLMRELTAVTRLRFLTIGNPQAIHEDFLDENAVIGALLADGQVSRARARLELYLLRAERTFA